MIRLLMIISAAIGIPAALITISGFIFGVCNFPELRSDRAQTAPNLTVTGAGLVTPTADVSPTATTYPTVTPRPTAVLSLDQMMLEAEAGTTSSGQDLAMREIAEIAVNRGNYEKAIEAGTRSASYSAEAETLAFVARRAVDEAEYGYALAAADAITLDEGHDDTRLDVFCAMREGLPSRLPSVLAQRWAHSMRYPTVDQMLKYANSSGTYSGRSEALRKVAEIAIVLGSRSGAIEAGKETPHNDQSVQTLTYVTRCFIEESQFGFALNAASAIPTYSQRDSMKVEVFAAVKTSSSQPFSAFADPISPSCR